MRFTLCVLALCVLALAALTGCPREPTPEPPAPARAEVFLAGDQVVTNAAGTSYPAQRTLVHRVTDPADASLHEEIVGEDGQGGVDELDLTGTIDADARTFTLTFVDAYGRLDGVGELEGDAWEWSAWSTRTEYADGPYAGSYIVSEDTLDEVGLVAHKEVFTPDDVFEVEIDETLVQVEEADWRAEANSMVAASRSTAR